MAPRSPEYGPETSPTPSIPAIFFSAGSMRDFTAASVTLPSSTFHTTVSVSPELCGKAFSIRSSARVESVSGRENSFAYVLPALVAAVPTPMSAASHSSTTTSRCR